MIRNWLCRWLGIEEGQKLTAKAITDLTAVCATLSARVLQNWDDLDNRATFNKERTTMAWDRIVAMEVEHSALSKKQAELSAILQEVRQLREMLADPKRQPIVARTTHQFRALMEQE